MMHIILKFRHYGSDVWAGGAGQPIPAGTFMMLRKLCNNAHYKQLIGYCFVCNLDFSAGSRFSS